MLAQNPNDLLFGKPASPHHSSPSDELTYQWHEFWGAGHRIWRICAIFSQYFNDYALAYLSKHTYEGKSFAYEVYEGDFLGLADIPIIDPERNNGEHRLALFTSAIRWIVHHEIAHIWNGHNEFLKIEIKKEEGQFSDIDLNDIKYVFEIDADSRASSGIINDLNILRDRSDFKNMDHDRFENTVLHVVHSALIGMFIAFYDSIITENREISYKQISHPLTKRRLYSAASGAMNALDKISVSKTGAFDLVIGSRDVYLNLLKALFDGPYIDLGVPEYHIEPRLSVKEVGDIWNRVGPVLTKYMRGFMIPGPYENGEQKGFYTRNGVATNPIAF